MPPKKVSTPIAPPKGGLITSWFAKTPASQSAAPSTSPAVEPVSAIPKPAVSPDVGSVGDSSRKVPTAAAASTDVSRTATTGPLNSGHSSDEECVSISALRSKHGIGGGSSASSSTAAAPPPPAASNSAPPPSRLKAPPAKRACTSASSSSSEEDSEGDASDDDDEEEEEQSSSARMKVPAARGAAGAAKQISGAKRKAPVASSSKGKGAAAAVDRDDEDDAAGDVDGGGDDTAGAGKAGLLSAGQHAHNGWVFLAGGRRDKAGRPPTHPSYNSRTLQLPPDFAKKLTPASQQWWQFKVDNMDTVLFFKQGKFYETFHMDADVCVKELGMIYMKGETAHAGFPEISYGHFSEKLVAIGYRVARIEQVETPQQLKDRNAAAGRGPKDKVVARALCGIKTKGTRTHSFLDVASGAAAKAEADSASAAAAASSSAAFADDASGGFLVALKEVPLDVAFEAAAEEFCTEGAAASEGGSSSAASACSMEHRGIVHIAAAVTDCATGEVRLAEFVDDKHRSRLRTLLARLPPAEFIYERTPKQTPAVKQTPAAAGAARSISLSGASGGVPVHPEGGLSAYTRRMMRFDAPAAVHTLLAPEEEFWSAHTTAAELDLSKYGVTLSPAGAPASVGSSAASSPAALNTAASSTLRQRDYFVIDAEAGDAASSTSSAAAAASNSDSGYGPLVSLRGSDGKERLVPQVLQACLARARAATFECALDPALLETLRAQRAETRATGGVDVPPGALCLSAVGATVAYLRRCLVDHSIISLRRFSLYVHADGGAPDAAATGFSPSGPIALEGDGGEGEDSGSSSSSVHGGPRGEGDRPYTPHLVLDGTSIVNLELLANSYDGSRVGTLLGLLEPGVATPFGRRRLKQWLCAPLFRAADVNDRLDAVEALMSEDLAAEAAAARRSMRGLPDLERTLSRIHALGSRVAAADHPDARAVMYEGETYSRRKIADLLAALKAFDAVIAVRQAFHEDAPPASLPSAAGAGGAGGAASTPKPGVPGGGMLHRLVHADFPDLRPLAAFFAAAFDAREAARTSKITPSKGVHPAFDAACAEVAAALAQLDEYLASQRATLKCASVAFWGSGKDRFQLEVPEAVAPRVPAAYSLKSRRAGARRYWTPAIESMLAALVAAEERREAAVRDSLRRVFARFDSHRGAWQAAISCVASLDCLLAMAAWSRDGDGGGQMCRPVFVSGDGGPVLLMEGARHPCMVASALLAADAGGAGVGGGGGSGVTTQVIPNDLVLGREEEEEEGAGAAAARSAAMAVDADAEEGAAAGLPGGPPCLLVTGANMGGKSSILRQTCLTVILAQLGCFVPADRFRLSPVDRVFTRVGASDRILAGQSTFYVELAETSTILNQATRRSLVILDELGRGTSTFDGNAIAFAVTKHLVEAVGCRTLFATHYHTLCDDFAAHPGVSLGHMGCIVDSPTEAGVGSGVGGAASGVAGPRITFLYKLVPGACPKSYGLNVARLALLPDSILAHAKAKSEEFERAVEAAKRGALPQAAASIQSSGEGDRWLAFLELASAFSLSGRGAAELEASAATLVEAAAALRAAC